MCRFLIVDDHVPLRLIIKNLLEAKDGWVVCGEAADGREAIAKCLALKPHLVVLDIQMPVMNGFDAAREIRRLSPATMILMLTSDKNHHFAQAAEDCGARGFLSKGHAAEHLAFAANAMLRGEKYFKMVN